MLRRIGLVAFLACPGAIAFQANIVPRAHLGDARPLSDSPSPHLRIDASMVLVPVHVTTDIGAPVTDLTKVNFRLFEEGVEQPINYFAKDDAPISIGLVFDASGSMQDKLKKSSEAAAAFFKTATSQDEFFLVEFNERPKLAVPFTADSETLYRRIVHSKPFGRTSLFDAVHLALAQMKQARNNRKAIVILSDGGDNRSRFTFKQIENAMLESDVAVYAMGIFDPEESKRLSPEERNGPHVLDELTEQSGGRLFKVDNINDLPEISERIGNELRNQYLLGFSPSEEARNGKYRRVKVTLVTPQDGPPLRVQYRPGYRTPSQ